MVKSVNLILFFLVFIVLLPVALFLVNKDFRCSLLFFTVVFVLKAVSPVVD